MASQLPAFPGENTVELGTEADYLDAKAVHLQDIKVVAGPR
jgi:hypothetical protein